jgi:PKD repeat protein
MQKHIPISLIVLLTISIVFPQNWSTIGGSNQRNGLSKIIGPDSVVTPYWSVSSSQTVIGNSIFTYGDKFVTARAIFSPYTSRIECRSLIDGSLIWEKLVYSTSILYAVGFSEDAVYAHDYSSDSLYALSPIDGSVKWAVSEYMFGGNTGILFACNGDPIVRGKRLDKNSGQTIWFYDYIVPVGPNAGYAASNTTFYHYSGTINTPKRLFALDIETGQFKYETVDLPGDGDQEWPITIGSDGTIFLKRDGGKLYAFDDTGSELRIKWQYTPTATEMPGYFGSDIVGNIYVIDNDTVKLLNKNDGSILYKSNIAVQGSFFSNISVDGEGKVYVNNNDNKMFCFSPDLQNVIWELGVPNLTYCGPALAKDGILVIAGAGFNIKAYKSNKQFKPVADFKADSTKIITGQSINLFDQSSFLPTAWQWSFPGGLPTSSQEQNPQNIFYNTPGTYEISLVATNALGTDTLIKSCYIEVEQAVPVELISFNATLLESDVKLDWITATETNNSGFEILRFTQIDNVWDKIGFIPGFGTTSEPKTYSFTDDNTSTGVNKYRLKQIDFDGSFTYSNEIEVDYSPNEFVLYQNYPNPFNPTTTISWQQPTESKVSITVYDILGNEFENIVDEVMPAGRHTINFSADQLPSGIYFYKIIAGNFVETKKMMLLK